MLCWAWSYILFDTKTNHVVFSMVDVYLKKMNKGKMLVNRSKENNVKVKMIFGCGVY